MRLICTLSDESRDENPFVFSAFLSQNGIEHLCEKVDTSYRIWIYDEDQKERATLLYKEYAKNPHDPIYHMAYAKALQQTEEQEEPPRIQPKRSPYGFVTLAILIIVSALFLFSLFSRNHLQPPQLAGIVQAPMLSPIEKTLLYDYPTYFALRDELFTLYTPQDIKEKKPPSKEALSLIATLQKTPLWMGIYDRIIAHYQKPSTPLSYDAPLFEKISKGEVWRLFTPTFLHLDLLHIFFNVLWFLLLGNQIERRIGTGRYLFFILLAAMVTNSAQYLISGPFFMGLSGVVCAFAGFIWARQNLAPWEGYLVHRYTLIFLAVFVLGMLALQIVFFTLQLLNVYKSTLPIANTAHIVGGILGYLLGRSSLFEIKRSTL